MLHAYPIKPIISSDKQLAANYNNDPKSAHLLSACLTPTEAADLLAQGAVFQDLVLVNGEGEELLSAIGDPFNWDLEIMPYVKRATISAPPDRAVAQLHEIIQQTLAVCGVG